LAKLIECDFNYTLKMNIQDDTSELRKLIAFKRPVNVFLNVTAKYLQLLLEEPDAT